MLRVGSDVQENI